MNLPLSGITVLEFAQYMAGPSAGLRLADLGARVIKIERPGSGEAGRALAIKNLFVDGDSLVFHTVNRNKESYAADLKDPEDLARVKALIARADVMTHNFRPGVMERIGLDYERARALNPRLVYGEVSGYGRTGPWKDLPGQDLLAQSRSGLLWLSGAADAPPVPFGLAVADILCGTHLVQGILAALVRRGRSGRGAYVECSLIESILDFQFEVLTTHLHDGGQAPPRAPRYNAHAYLAAPYGIYPTGDGHLALAMGSVPRLGELLEIPALEKITRVADWFSRRDEIQELLAARLRTSPTRHWLGLLDPHDIWCSDVLDYRRLLRHEGWRVLQFAQTVRRSAEVEVRTTRCPIRIDGQALYSAKAAPRVGESNAAINREFLHA
jgi:CoA:oxalate CoA-transferase